MSAPRTVPFTPTGCVLHKVHRPKPTRLEKHHVLPIYLAKRLGIETRDTVLMCEGGHTDVHVALNALLVQGPTPKGIGAGERKFARKALALFVEAADRRRCSAMIYAVLGYEPRQLVMTASEQVEWAELYMQLAPSAGIRTGIAYAQACHETGYFRFPGQANAAWNNPAGLGVTGAIDPATGAYIGNRFPNKEAGVRAHLGHLLWYYGAYHPVAGFCEVDQRHFGLLGGHKRLENDMRAMDGRWAVPGVGYGEKIARLALELVR